MSQIKILVVDDESRMRKLVKDFLIRKDYAVLEAANGEEAVDVFVGRHVRKSAHCQRFRLLCLPLNRMRGMSCWDLS